MKKFLSTLLGLVLAVTLTHAQADHKLDSQTVANDKIIMHEILAPALKSAGERNETPDWKMLGAAITARFDSSYTLRNITKAKIFYFYGSDWGQFCAALVQYTQNYEWRDSLSLMNKNAKMILENSANPADWKAAQSWVKYAVEKAPSNGEYKATYDALAEKINGK